MKKINSYIGIERASLFLGIDHHVLKRMTEQKLIAFYRHPFNGGCMFKQEDLDNFKVAQGTILPLKEKHEEEK